MRALRFEKVKLKDGTVVQQIDTGSHFIDFRRADPGPQGRGLTLVVSFEAFGTRDERPNNKRLGWGQKFLADEGYSTLCVKPKLVNWYRCADLHLFFRSAEAAELFSRHAQVIFYGSSMGGYASLAFAAAVPGSIAIAYSPQTTLSSSLVPWEIRFRTGREADWSGDFSDAAASIQLLKRAYVSYDPFNRLDCLHVDRLVGDNVMKLRAPGCGHNLPAAFLEMRILKGVFRAAAEDVLDPLLFAQMLRRRRNIGRYYTIMSGYAKCPGLKQVYAAHAERLNPTDPKVMVAKFRRAFEAEDLNEADSILAEIIANSSIQNRILAEAAAQTALLHTRSGNDARAAEIIDSIKHKDIKSYSFNLCLAEAQLRLGRFADAERHAKIAVQSATAPKRAQQLLLEILVGARKARDAGRLLRDLQRNKVISPRRAKLVAQQLQQTKAQAAG